MAVSTSELMASAEAIDRSATEEADFRCACSRAYYAIFHDSDAFHQRLPTHGVVPKCTDGGMHATLIQQLINPSVPRGDLYFRSMSIGYLMKSLYAKRIKADYKREVDIDKTTATSAIAEAREILVKIRGESDIPAATATQPSARATPPEQCTTGRPTLTRIK